MFQKFWLNTELLGKIQAQPVFLKAQLLLPQYENVLAQPREDHIGKLSSQVVVVPTITDEGESGVEEENNQIPTSVPHYQKRAGRHQSRRYKSMKY